jgi:DUF1365 family protein
MIKHSQICRGSVVHQRISPVPHAFTYPATFFAFDLAELDHLSQQASLFGYNDTRLISIHDQHYLHGKKSRIEHQLDCILPPQIDGEHTLLITSPRYLGYAFNPVNFYLRMRGDQLVAAVAEVNNTFGDRHVYPLPDLIHKSTHTWTAYCPKEFHVSPFNDLAGDYHFTFTITADTFHLGVDLHRDGDCVLKTWIQGTKNTINNSSIWKHAILHPFDTALNSMPRILWQAAQLYYKKKLQIHNRPSPTSAATLIDRDHTDEPANII